MSDAKDFLFGVSSSAYHIEGGNEFSDWHAFEEELFKNNPEHKNKDAIDYWNRWTQDHEHLTELGVDAFRTSIEWSRIQPNTADHFDEKAIDQYCQMLSDLKRRNIRVVLTFVHYVVPKWFSDKGGFEKKENLIYFERFVEKILQSCGEYVDVITPVNEMMVHASFGYLIRFFPPNKQNPISFISVLKNLIRAHFIVTRIARELRNEVQISTAEQFRFVYGKPSFLMAPMSWLANYLVNDAVLQSIVSNRFYPPFGTFEPIDTRVKNPVDVVGIQVYGSVQIRLAWRSWHPTIKPVGYTYWADAVYDAKVTARELEFAVNRTAKRYSKPVLITEVGLASEDQTEHESKLNELVGGVEQMLEKGSRLSGFLYFTLFDCFEWNHGFNKKFGLIEIDRQNNLRRKPKPAYYVYQKLIKKVKTMLGPKTPAKVETVKSNR